MQFIVISCKLIRELLLFSLFMFYINWTNIAMIALLTLSFYYFGFGFMLIIAASYAVPQVIFYIIVERKK